MPATETLSPSTAALISRAMAKREAAGLKVTWMIPASDGVPEREWSAFASSAEVRAEWIANGERKGWTLLS